MKSFEGYLKKKLGDSYILLAGGSHKTLSDFSMSGHNHNDLYVSSLTTSGNYLRWIKNGSNNDITVPYATNADTIDGWHAIDFWNYKTPSKSSGYWDVNEVRGETIAAWAYGFADSTSVIHGPVGDKVSDARAYYTLGGVYCPLQLSWYYTDSASLYARTYYNGTWYSWKKVAFTEDLTWSNVSSKPETATRWPSWSEVTDKPSSLPANGGNADTVDSLHGSNLVRFFLSPMTSGAPADSAKSWFTGTMPSSSGAIVYNVPGSEKTIIAGKSSGAYGHMLQLNYDDNYLRLLRYQGGSWKTTDWEKISAGYADSAGNADTVDGYHASSFAVSGHTHRYINSSGFSDNGSTSLSTWGTLTTSNGYTGILNINDGSGGSWEIAYKSGLQFHQIDGYYYQNEGRYRCIDTSDVSGLSVKSATTSTYTNLLALNTSPSSVSTEIGSWDPNPVGGGRRIYGQRWYLSGTSDPGDMTLYINPLSSAGGGGVTMCLDGYYYSLSGFLKGGYNDNYFLLAGGGAVARSSYASSSHGHDISSITWAPSSNLRVDATGNSLEWSIDIYRNGYSSCYWHIWDSSLGSLFIVYPDNGNTWTYGNATASNFYTKSDIRYKEFISDITSAIPLKFKLFTLKETNNKSFGLIAQELELDYPYLVGVDEDGYKTVNYTAALCLTADQLLKKVSLLETTVKELAEKIKSLEKRLILSR